MKKHLLTITIILAGLVSFSACQDEEDIIPSNDYSPIRGGFPQGTTMYDSLINDIKQEYGVYLIYKNITENDLNRNWVTDVADGPYIAGYEDERNDTAWHLPEKHLPFYVDFFYNHIFPNIKKDSTISYDFAKSSFPVKIYMIHNLRVDTTVNKSATVGDPYKSIKIGTFDNWAISFKDEIINGGDDEYTMQQQRCIFMLKAIYNSMEKGDITVPEEFWEGLHFEKERKIEYKDSTSENYKYRLGFIDEIYDHFGTGRLKELWRPLYQTVKSCEYWERGYHASYNLFNVYMKSAMWFTPEEFREYYHTDEYPIVAEKYEITVKHLLENYGVDLQGIARGVKNKK